MNYLSRKPRYLVVLTEEPGQKREFYLENQVYSVGRHSRNDIVLYSECVSRHHATFLKVKYNHVEQDEVFWIIDGDLKGNRSTNGLIVNEKRCLSHELKHGDIITLANQVTIQYYQINNHQSPNIHHQKEKINNYNLANLKETSKTKTIAEAFPDQSHQEFFNKLNDYSKFIPHPIIEINYQGQIVYANSIAKFKILSLEQLEVSHPIFLGLLDDLDNTQESFLIRDLNLGSDIFQECVQYLPQEKLIRIYLFDLTKQIETESALQATEAKYKAIVSQISEGLILIDLTTRQIIDCNLAYCNLLNYTQGELLELTIYDLLPIDDEIIDSYLEKIIAKKQELVIEGCHCSKDNELIDVEVSISLIKYGDKQALCLAVRDIRERKKTEKLLLKQAYYDPLTGLANRTLLNQKLEQAIEIAQKLKHQVAVLFFDLDHFKKINDSLGHGLGDKLLKSFAKRILTSLGSCQTFARWGGDEFILLLPNIQQIETVIQTIDKIIESLEAPFSIEGNQLHIRISVGIACYPQDGKDKETLLRNADAVLYRIKQQGRNCYQFYNAQTNAQSSELLTLENLLYQAIEKQELFLNYQPQIHLKTNKILGVECLLRWHNSEIGMISTPKFIRIAEETGLITSIGNWVLKKACEEYKQWQTMGIAPKYIAVNLSPRQLQQDDLLNNLEQILQETGLKPSCLALEITESSLIEDTESASEVLLALVGMGINITLDDFGTGYASLAYLKKFPFHTLKIDRSFIKDITDSQQNPALVSAIINLAKALNLTVIAEGIETQEQLNILQDLNCEAIQGYYFSVPLGSQEIHDFLKGYRSDVSNCGILSENFT
ncbi:EAL domain-containing protein [Gloeocapsa sp. PCC 73106]|uniref:EAL domain-containing protein n=1 Tax=Gloeocapsa sp. PCC 73106 TaxID=102232 RepID=UPI0002AB9AFC|nr:EAL domain-containing protein [Gloeocapsa sp. PCC 73106]ELS00027.1 PAS domain S-box/diguanylate cyclase (GGDEF) domain-containing protein [Gloeocapsa sp. PCC 73106]